MRIAYYAPLKPVDHPVPSGDRLMARAFKALLEGLGHEVEIASTLRSFDRGGDVTHQLALRDQAGGERRRLLRAYAGGLVRAYAGGLVPDLWFTYHAYHKAPDWLGPAVSEARAIPYVVAEASIAGKQAGGPWDLGHRATLEAVNAADAVLALTRVDAQGLRSHMRDPARVVVFPPFLLSQPTDAGELDGARRQLAATLGLPLGLPWLVTVAMMRQDIKLDSYRLLATALEKLAARDWRLLVVGDGEAGDEVRHRLRAVVGDKVRFLGERPAVDVARLCAAGDLFVWPALDEAYGMAILEALAAGLPVVACDEGGVADLVEHETNGLLAQQRSAAVLAAHLDRLIGDPDLRRRLGAHAASRVAERHSRAAAAARLGAVLAKVAGRSGELPCG
jgi:glycosyltransferase involved in cell wall biosynthesis